MKIFLLALACYFIALIHAQGFNKNRGTCTPEGNECGISVDGFNGAQCCKGSFCVRGVCKAFTNTIPKQDPRGQKPPSAPGPPAKNPRLMEICRGKLANAGCGNNPVDAIGPFCVCKCPAVYTSSTQFASDCVPSMQDRINTIRICANYKAIRDCPQYQRQSALKPQCKVLKQQFLDDCAACGSRCTSLIEKGNGNNPF